MQNYEIYLILNPLLDEAQIENEIESIKKVLSTDIGIDQIEVVLEGPKALAYPINKQNNGYYATIKFNLELEDMVKIAGIEKKFNLLDNLYRYLILNQTDFYKTKAKEKLNTQAEVKHQREFNKGVKNKKDITNFLGIKAVDFRNVEYLNQFTSPYSKIFGRERTGSTAKNQRKINQAIKRARHMALMPFTPKHKV